MSSFRTIELSDAQFESQGLRFLTVKTPNLQGRGDICLFVPSAKEEHSLPIYILLHGVYGSAWSWALQGGAAQTAQRMMAQGVIKPAIIAMPSDGLWGDGSAYFAHHQKKFDEWIVHDVPLAIRENIPAASNNSLLCIGGLSMGGYGALSLGIRFSEKFRAISGHSSITQLAQMAQFVEEPLDTYANQCPSPDLIDLLRQNVPLLPPIRFDCGLADPLLTANQLLHQQLTESSIPHEYQEFAGGHEWQYWQEHLSKSLLFFDRSIKD
jgi:enterochelin esterase-like enzyme